VCIRRRNVSLFTFNVSRIAWGLERAMGFEPHSVAGSALKPASRLLLRGPAPSHAPHERGAPLSKSPVVGSTVWGLRHPISRLTFHFSRSTFHGLRVKKNSTGGVYPTAMMKRGYA